MKLQRLVKLAAGAVLALSVIVLMGIPSSPPLAQAQDGQEGYEAALVQIGFKIAPVPLNLHGRNRSLVGLGSFLVNAIGDCNGCHTAGGPPNFNYANGGNPYFGQRTKTDPTTYLAGGTDFGPAVPPSAFVGGFPPGSEPPYYPPAEYGNYVGPDIISRNLTPDKTGRAEGGNTLAQFKAILRNGTDFDHLHPTCTTATPAPAPANCIPPPVNGNLLQIMPWPTFHNMTDHQIEAIYEYLSSIPCIEGPATPGDLPPALQYAFPALHNDCGDSGAISEVMPASAANAPHSHRRHSGRTGR
jgi:hypothetical protein